MAIENPIRSELEKNFLFLKGAFRESDRKDINWIFSCTLKTWPQKTKAEAEIE